MYANYKCNCNVNIFLNKVYCVQKWLLFFTNILGVGVTSWRQMTYIKFILLKVLLTLL